MQRPVQALTHSEKKFINRMREVIALIESGQAGLELFEERTRINNLTGQTTMHYFDIEVWTRD